MKIGDKVWVLCEVVSEPEGNGIHVTHRGAGWYADLSACKPVEHEAFQLRKPNAIFTMQGHARQGTYGVAKYNETCGISNLLTGNSSGGVKDNISS
jgi:hypothetical protein